ncbi:MAG: glycerophosphodiester phosphodiesterase family protein [Desulfobacterales bacterium]|jgi:glycerophosphoryl diester phosphodiesterase
MNKKVQTKDLLCIGHRGAMGHAPENTLLSIRKALELGTPCIEMDVYNVDGHLVVFHDIRLERTTNGTGYLLDQSFDELRTLDAGRGEKIPTLKEAFETIQSKAGVNIELKGPDTARPVAEFISGMKEIGRNDDLLLVSSFNHRELSLMHRLNPKIKLGAMMVGLPVDDAAFGESLGAYSVHLSLESIDPRFVKDAHARDLRVFVFTVDLPEDIEKMRGLGVDGVFTNYPERVLKNNTVTYAAGWP